jgi:hypothetical protein
MTPHTGGAQAPAMPTAHYDVIVRGCLGPALISAFEGLTPITTAASTSLRGELDQAALHGVLQRVEGLGLELLDVRRI